MLALVIFIVLAVLVLVVIELRERKRQKQPSGHVVDTTNRDTDCCGEHLVCEKETLLNTNAEVVYYDDEYLDQLAGIDAEQFTKEQYEQISQVFYTLQESDVVGWCRSLQMRNINLPIDIREEALLIIKEFRQNK